MFHVEHFAYGRFSSPHVQSWSRIFIREIPRSDRRYSTLGGTWGYSLRIISRSLSNSFREALRDLWEMEGM